MENYKTIKFRSVPAIWKKEYLNLKRNTIRSFNSIIEEDYRENILKEHLAGKCSLLNVMIENTETKETFVRSVTDVTYYQGYYIISW